MAYKKNTDTEAVADVSAVAVSDKKKKYNPEDLIDCMSTTNGGLYVNGAKSNYLYSWADYGDVIGVEYRDLVFMIRSHDKAVFQPRFVIEDDDIVSEYPELVKLYGSMYSNGDLVEIIKLSPSKMAKAIEQLPAGAKESLKGIAATMIDNGSLDSIQKVKVLDEIFGTKLLLTLVKE